MQFHNDTHDMTKSDRNNLRHDPKHWVDSSHHWPKQQGMCETMACDCILRAAYAGALRQVCIPHPRQSPAHHEFARPISRCKSSVVPITSSRASDSTFRCRNPIMDVIQDRCHIGWDKLPTFVANPSFDGGSSMTEVVDRTMRT
jgi:hypothetical protein